MRIADRIVVVTGASRGIGAAMARALGHRGARVVLLARTLEGLEAVAAEVAAAGGEATLHAVDLTDPEGVERTTRAVLERTGVPDVVINNAGAGRWLFTEETSATEAVRMMAVPYFAAFYVTRAFLPHMLRRRSGRIVNVTSAASRIVWPGATAYTAARWAMRGFTEALRADLRGTGLGVTLVTAGKVSSTYWQHNPGSEERVPRIARLIPTMTPDAVAARVARALERESEEIVIPSVLKLLYLVHALLPRTVQGVTTRTGWPHPLRAATRAAGNEDDDGVPAALRP